MEYPGDTATPTDVALYFASVAASYGLPRILPVMTSCVELTEAWTGPGNVRNVTGYLYAVDYWSVGYFQQQYDGNPDGTYFGWGTYEQLIDAEYAVHRFCQEARKFIDWEWHANTTDPDALGRWCQAIQRSAFPDAYRDKGYPMAVELLKESDKKVAQEEFVTVQFDQPGWGYVMQGDKKLWVKVEPGENLDKITYDSKKWMWAKRKQVEVPKTKFNWPKANAAPVNSWNYQDRHPTRYNWRPDVEEWARYLVENYDVWCNTYYEHPEGWGFNHQSTDADGTKWYVQDTSFDVWGPAGRNDPLDPDLGDEIYNLLFHYAGKPDIDWIIWKRQIWTVRGGYSAFGTEPFSWHDDHIHITYL